MRPTFLVSTFLLLGSCGGGGSAPQSPPINMAPSFTSSSSAKTVENAAGMVYQASAADPEAAAITYTITGGADFSRFTISAGGALTFATAPNFDLPRDSDGDNVYQVRLGASDGSQSASLDLMVTVTNSKEGIDVRRVATGFSQPLYVAAIPGETDVFVAEKGGNIFRLNPETGARTLLVTATNLSTDGERGLLGMTAGDRWPSQQHIYVVATNSEGAIQVREYFLRSSIDPINPFGVVLSVPHGDFNNHNGGWIGYGPDGFLYVAIGDGGGSGDPGNNAQNPNSRLGKILRIARNPDPFAGASVQFYVPAPGNPFIGGAGDPFVFALGLRNPFRASFAEGRLLIGDVGQNNIEEISGVQPGQPGRNFGWPFLEGTRPFRGTQPSGVVAPLSEYGHGSGPRQGNSIVGGYAYRGPVTSLRGQYLFGDFASGNIWSVPLASLIDGQTLASSEYERRNDDLVPNQGRIDQLVSFGEDAAGNLYIIDLDGDIFRINPA